MEKKANKAKLEIFKILRNWLNRKAIAFDKIIRNCAFYGNQQIYTYWGIFACRIHICDENSTKSYGFHENAKIIENHSFC